jgi:hypothetical protein
MDPCHMITEVEVREYKSTAVYLEASLLDSCLKR